MSDIVISVKNISKEYRFYKTNHQRLMHELLGKDTGESVLALKDVSFDIARGEKVAILGNSGSGKSAVMRILAGVIPPTEGTVEISDKVMPMLDFKAGMIPNLSGKENIDLKAAVLGLTKEFNKEHIDNVIQFTNLEKVIDMPIRTYPAGMPTVIGFTVMSELKPEILIYDEKFTFGGLSSFRNKCTERLEKLATDPDVTFLMSVNSYKFAKAVCSRGIVLEKGSVVFDGPYQKAAKFFNENFRHEKEPNKGQKKHTKIQRERPDNTEVDDF